MAILPATGSAIAIGKTNQAFTNVVPGTAGDANGVSGGQNIKLSGVLGAKFAARSTGTSISLSATFGGRSTPYPYP